MDLKDEIAAILRKKQTAEEAKVVEEDRDRTAVEAFMRGTVASAFETFADALRGNGREVKITLSPLAAHLVVRFQGKEEMDYRVEWQQRNRVAPVRHITERGTGKRFSSTGHFRSGLQDYGVENLTQDEIVQHMLGEYRSAMSP